LLLWRHGTRRPGGIRIVGIAGWAAEPVLILIHGETGGGGGAARRGVNDAVGGRGRIESGGAGLLGGGGIVAGSAGSALRTKAAKVLEPRSHQVRHIRRSDGGNNADAIIQLDGSGSKGREQRKEEEGAAQSDVALG